MSKLAVVVTSMSSLEIAELTGKRHDHVMNDIRKMLEELKVLTPVFSGMRKNQQMVLSFKFIMLDHQTRKSL